ncbi:Cobalamin synthase [hydrothermal vent metagenome]|uniref:Adenosylcobinamide-GDP ribazoletransferase n=1 Tax=hydrothermal vent metagenome TaxID=652676 RepID=A0A3B1BCI9_9ZZZZ
MKKFFSAVSFLTALPVPAKYESEPGDLSESVNYFMVVGGCIGVALIIIDWTLLSFTPVWVSATMLVIAMSAVSGALHMDGLADSADAFFSGAGKERALEIMKDSACGPMGALSILSVFTLKVASLASIPADVRWMALLAAPLAGRCAMVAALSAMPYVRNSNGLGTAFEPGQNPARAWWASLVLLGVSLLTFGFPGFWVALGAVSTAVLFMIYCDRKLGGMTGDTYGALCEICETATLVIASAMLMKGV